MTNFSKDAYTKLDAAEKETYLNHGVNSVRNRTYDAINKGKDIVKELDEVIKEAIRIKRHFIRMQREYTKLEDELTQIEQSAWEIEDATGRNLAGNVIPPEEFEEVSVLDTLLNEVSHTPRKEEVPNDNSLVKNKSFLDDIMDM